ncbi:uncharacterized protein BCR38DRAFT_438903 [Pseudomassariella vexata]|uniref:Uncharacterized protein n=1 Tax=Pseudomassariella vexata TaxID=1141098 RepID=A0A1Y2DV40_9PEZI|nr:uncharacterized protein BCR38DRAFT_438903 [Pseudomassariella vexata]ORY62515.1 hypothetical protein BCR38DRAFT_438903 [Pseudomassariella vexata]
MADLKPIQDTVYGLEKRISEGAIQRASRGDTAAAGPRAMNGGCEVMPRHEGMAQSLGDFLESSKANEAVRQQLCGEFKTLPSATSRCIPDATLDFVRRFGKGEIKVIDTESQRGEEGVKTRIAVLGKRRGTGSNRGRQLPNHWTWSTSQLRTTQSRETATTVSTRDLYQHFGGSRLVNITTASWRVREAGDIVVIGNGGH